MVFFCCTACNEPLRKQVVETHFSRCRDCRTVSCMECHKDFDRKSYKVHTTCSSEFGKHNKRRSATNDNIDWGEVIKVAIDKCPSNDHRIPPILRDLAICPNLPKKQKKFENFMASKYPRLPFELVGSIWNLLSTVKSSLLMHCGPVKQSRLDGKALELKNPCTPATTRFDFNSAVSNAIVDTIGSMSLAVLTRRLYADYVSSVTSGESTWTKHQFKQELISYLESNSAFDFSPATGLIQLSGKSLSFTNGHDSSLQRRKSNKMSHLITDILISKNGRIRLKRLIRKLCSLHQPGAVLSPLSEDQILHRLEKTILKGTQFHLSKDGNYVLLNKNTELM